MKSKNKLRSGKRSDSTPCYHFVLLTRKYNKEQKIWGSWERVEEPSLTHEFGKNVDEWKASAKEWSDQIPCEFKIVRRTDKDVWTSNCTYLKYYDDNASVQSQAERS